MTSATKTEESVQFDTLTLELASEGDRLVAFVQLNRPDSKNAMTFVMAEEFIDLMTRLHATTNLAAVVLSGAQGSFCSGGDLSWLADSGGDSVADLRARMRFFYDAFRSIGQLPVPTIAAIEGAAIGAGMAIAAAMDLRVVALDAKVGAPFTHLGLHPGMASTHSLPRLVGESVANDVLLTGRILTGVECGETGFASRVCEPGRALEVATKMALKVARAAPVATDFTLQALREGMPTADAALQWEALAQPVTMQTADAAEGLTAAAEKRRPSFTGR